MVLAGPHPRLRSAGRLIAGDALVVITGVVFYFGVRGLTAGSPETARAHARDVLAVEEALGLDFEQGVQDLMVHIDWLTTLANWIYIWGHWPAIVFTLVWLALHNRVIFVRARNAMIASGALGLCVYTTYPVAPPRLLDSAYVDTVTERSNAYRVLQPPGFTNQYAAMPSLHVGWDLIIGLAIAAAAGTLVFRTLGRLMPVLMAAATVVTANHYVLDVIIGAAFGLFGWAVALQLEKRRLRATATATPPALPAPPPVTPAPAGADRRVAHQLPRPRQPGVPLEDAPLYDRRRADAP